MPPAGSDRKLERDEVDGWINALTSWTPKASLMESPQTFDNWVLGHNPDGTDATNADPERTALVILSHQEGDKLFQRHSQSAGDLFQRCQSKLRPESQMSTS